MDIVIENANILQVPADLIALKHADGFYGADRVVADAVGFSGTIPFGSSRFFSSKNIAAREALFIGVGPLVQFRYEQMQDFSRTILKIARTHNKQIRHIALTIHGPGYGLDAEEAFLSIIAGFIEESNQHKSIIEKITIAETSEKRCKLLYRILQERKTEFDLEESKQLWTVTVRNHKNGFPPDKFEIIDRFGSRAEEKPTLFIAMPFAEEFLDEFEIGFCEAAKENAFICERLDLEHFVGDVFHEIKQRIVKCKGVIALLNSSNPNVFLEIGYAMAHNKPIIFVARVGTSLPFDIRGQKCINYKNIGDLRKKLTEELFALNSQGVLV